MIEITHRQAQRLVREGMDGRLPDEQWAALQAHLESCADCRAFQLNLTRTERGLRRALQQRWGSVRGPGGDPAARVLQARELRKKLLHVGGRAAMVLGVLAVIVLYIGYRRATAPPPTPLPDVSSPGALAPATATPQRADFRAVTAFVSNQEGNRDIYLYNPGAAGKESEPVNLTSDPGEDYSPAWSPDGEWIAFLSDRSGKPEVYVMHIAGSRLTRLTDEPFVDWQGPLSWSAGGEWIGLVGKRRAMGSGSALPYVYLVPMRGDAQAEGPRLLAMTGGTTGWLAFSPTRPMLAYTMDAPGNELMVYNTETGYFTAVTWEDGVTQNLRVAQNGAFDWSPDGSRLVYLAEGPFDPQTGGPVENAGSQVRATIGLDQFITQVYDSKANQVLESLPSTGVFRHVAWVPSEEGRMVAYLQDEEGSGCWTLHLRLARQRDSSPRNLPGLCVESEISYPSWTSDERWLVVHGYRPGETERALYALRVPADLLSAQEETIERLADVEAGASPVVRPKREVLPIRPQAAAPHSLEPAPKAPAWDTPGRLVYSEIVDSVPAAISAVLPGDGPLYEPLFQVRGEPAGANQENSCPAVSPDGSRVAFLSDRNAKNPRTNEVYVMDADGQNVRQRTEPVFPYTANQSGPYGDALPRYDCPVWSADGTKLAAVIRTVRGNHLAVIPVGGEEGVTYLPITAASYTAGPLWLPDSRRVMLALQRSGMTPPRLVTIDTESGLLFDAAQSILAESDGWGDMYGMALSPEGQQVAFLVAYRSATQPTTLVLHMLDMGSGKFRVLSDFYETGLNGWLGGDSVAWLPDGRISFLIRQRMDAKVKSTVLTVRIDGDLVETQSVLESEEVIYDTAWSPDGNWFAYTTESGLWVQDAAPVRENPSGPFRLVDGKTYQVDWR